MPAPELVIIGPAGGAHVGSHLSRAASRLGIRNRVIDTAPAYAGNRLARVIAWHALGRRPLGRRRFSERLWADLRTAVPRQVITVGQTALTRSVLDALHAAGAKVCNYSTDDPFNPQHRAAWHLVNLQAHDTVFTTRTSNIEDLRKVGCKDVRYLPFAFDEACAAEGPPGAADAEPEALFVGGADADRADFFRAFLAHGVPTAVAGGYWNRWVPPGARNLGLLDIEEIKARTARVAVNLCLVRRANRDGHVMRSFEIPAAGGFMLAERTGEHRGLFGPEGECVLYFSTPGEAAEKCRWALSHPAERQRMAAAAHARITSGRHSYRDRLQTILGAIA